MRKILEKTERRLGEKLFIKGERCLGSKCAVVRRKYPPGVHGKKGGKRQSAFGFKTILSEKQKIRFLYGLDDKDLARYSREAVKRGVFGETILKFLETRLDNVAFRLNLAPSRRAARQMVNHGHITVNGKTVRAPSYQTRPGDRIAVKDRLMRSSSVAGRAPQIERENILPWLRLETEGGRMGGIIVSSPETADIGVAVDPAKVKEFYSR